jgi:preprotein translocase subunit SecE
MAANNLKTKKDAGKSEKKEPGKIVRLIRKLGRFFIDLRSELKRVVWPDRKKLIHSTIIVLAICISAGIFLWLVDSLLMGILNGVGFYNPQTTTAVTTISTTVGTTTATTAGTTTATTAGTTTKP